MADDIEDQDETGDISHVEVTGPPEDVKVSIKRETKTRTQYQPFKW